MRVSPLYKHVFPPAAAPRLAFIGLLYKSLRNVQFELQVLLGGMPAGHELLALRKLARETCKTLLHCQPKAEMLCPVLN